MNKKRFAILFITALVLEILLLNAGFDLTLTAVICFFILIGGYIGWWVITFGGANKILNEQCDPEKYIERYEKLKRISKRPSFQMNCDNNIAAGFICLGREKEALEILSGGLNSGVKISRILETIYRANIFICYVNLGDLVNAEREYENHLKAMRAKAVPFGPAYVIDESVAYYQYLHNKTPETANLFLAHLDHIYSAVKSRNSTRGKLEIIFRKAEVLQELNDLESAAKKYKTVSENGNGLWIARESKRRLEAISLPGSE